MSKHPRVTVEYSGSTGYDLDPSTVGGIVDDLGPDPTDEQIVEAVRKDANAWLEYSGNASPPATGVSFDRGLAIETVREEIAARAAEDDE